MVGDLAIPVAVDVAEAEPRNEDERGEFDIFEDLDVSFPGVKVSFTPDDKAACRPTYYHV